MIKTILISILIFLSVVVYAQAKDNWKVISIPTHPEVWVLEKDVNIEGRIEIWGQGMVTKVTIKKGAKIYFSD